MDRDNDDLYYIERAARHVEAGLRGLDNIPRGRMSRSLMAQYTRLDTAERLLRVIRDRGMKRQGISIEDVDAWDSP